MMSKSLYQYVVFFFLSGRTAVKKNETKFTPLSKKSVVA